MLTISLAIFRMSMFDTIVLLLPPEYSEEHKSRKNWQDDWKKNFEDDVVVHAADCFLNFVDGVMHVVVEVGECR